MSHPIEARRCKQCGNSWYAKAGYSSLSLLPQSRAEQARHRYCASCGGDKVKTVRGRGFVPTTSQQVHLAAAPVVNVNYNVNSGGSVNVDNRGAFDMSSRGGESSPHAPTWASHAPAAAPLPAHLPLPHGEDRAVSSSTRWWKSPRFWFFALPLATGGLAAWVPPLWVSSKVHEGELKARLYVIAAAVGALAFIGAGLLGSAPVDATGSATGPLADIGVALALIAIAIGTWTAVVHRQRVFPDGATQGPSPAAGDRSLPGVQEAQARRQRRAQYRSLAAEDVVLAREMGLGRPDRTPAFDDGGLLDLNALSASALERYAGVTAAEAASIVSTRERLVRLSSVDELVVHGDLTLPTAERLREYAVFIG